MLSSKKAASRRMNLPGGHNSSFHIICFIPPRKRPQSFPDADGRPEIVILFQAGAVGVGDGHVAGLHGHQFFVRLKIVIWGQHTGGYQFFLQGLNIIQQVFRRAAADVVHRVRRQGQAVFAGFLFRRAFHDAKHALHNVVHIGKIPLAVAVIEDGYGFALHQLLGGAEIEHVGPPRRAVHRKEAQAGGGDIVQLGIAVGQQLVALLGGGVERNGVVHLVLRAERHFFVAAVYAAAGSVHQMLHRIVTAGF